MTVHYGNLLNLFDNLFNERSQSRKSSDYIASNDALDTLLDVIEGGIEELNKTHVTHLLLVLFVAGTDSTSQDRTSASNRQRKFTRGIRCKSFTIFASDRQRNLPDVPLLLPRRAGFDADLCGFRVPEGSQVLVNAWAIGRDPSIWENPNNFIPEIFLESEIDVKGRHFGLIPFGAGRRVRPGLPLANRMLHLMLGSLINSFDWKLEGGISPNELNMEEKLAITL
ncbi:geraniol 8-hydroxylase-like [Hibiscus syriacus]|uniref:geraniol 8-hydroxylase-like n=1 Tax=Hibiscus syriacus TaxID=106335 RepID=UPI00192430E1|nr:geraniol 8-hydroxylase-like [Hibiscus syriacus]